MTRSSSQPPARPRQREPPLTRPARLLAGPRQLDRRSAGRLLAPDAVHQLGVTVVSDHAAVGAFLRRLAGSLTAQLTVVLVLLVWGVASEALREIITGFLDEVRFD